MKRPIKLPPMTRQDDVYDKTLELADRLRHAMRGLYDQQYEKGEEFGATLANISLAALTIVWLESVRSSWNTINGESAIAILRAMEGKSDEGKQECVDAANDFLRRSGWSKKGGEAL